VTPWVFTAKTVSSGRVGFVPPIAGSGFLLNLLDAFSSFGRIFSNLFRPVVLVVNNVAAIALERLCVHTLYRVRRAVIAPVSAGVSTAVQMLVRNLSPESRRCRRANEKDHPEQADDDSRAGNEPGLAARLREHRAFYRHLHGVPSLRERLPVTRARAFVPGIRFPRHDAASDELPCGPLQL
jgi:hypothetical protein